MYQEKKKYELLRAGLYAFTIMECDCEHIAKSGNKSIKLVLEIITKDGKKYKVYEYLTKKFDPKTNKPYFFIIAKIEDLLKSIGRPDLIGKKLTNSDLLNASGHAWIKIEEARGEWRESNKVDRFASPQEVELESVVNGAAKTISLSPETEFDDIPF